MVYSSGSFADGCAVYARIRKCALSVIFPALAGYNAHSNKLVDYSLLSRLFLHRLGLSYYQCDKNAKTLIVKTVIPLNHRFLLPIFQSISVAKIVIDKNDKTNYIYHTS